MEKSDSAEVEATRAKSTLAWVILLFGLALMIAISLINASMKSGQKDVEFWDYFKNHFILSILDTLTFFLMFLIYFKVRINCKLKTFGILMLGLGSIVIAISLMFAIHYFVKPLLDMKAEMSTSGFIIGMLLAIQVSEHTSKASVETTTDSTPIND